MSTNSKPPPRPVTIKKLPGKVLKGVAAGLGFEIRRKRPEAPVSDPKPLSEFARAYQIVENNTMVAIEGLESLYSQVEFCEKAGLPGDYVECGVWKGGSVGIIAQANLKHGKQRRHIHLFDAFDDICEPDAKVDGERAIREVQKWSKGEGRLVPVKGIYDQFGGHGTLKENRSLLEKTIGYPSEFLHYYEGWFQETLPVHSHQIKEIALLRLDADWYASTKVCLDHLFDKLVPGGFLIIDDYGAYDGCRKAVDEVLSQFKKPQYLNVVNSEIRYLIKPQD